MPLPPNIEFDQQPEGEGVLFDAQSTYQEGYAAGARKACQAILMVIDQGGELADVRRVAQGAIDRMEMDDADVRG